MSEYIIEIDRVEPCADCQREPCIEICCEHAPIVRTGKRMEQIVRCKDCIQMETDANGFPFWCKNFIFPTLEYGYCAWGENVVDE